MKSCVCARTDTLKNLNLLYKLKLPARHIIFTSMCHSFSKCLICYETLCKKLRLNYVFIQLVTLILKVFCSQFLKLWKRTKQYKYNTRKLIALTAPLIHTHKYTFTQCPALYLLNQHLEPKDIYRGALWKGSTVNCILCVYQKSADATNVNLISTLYVTGSEMNADDLLKHNIKGICMHRNTIVMHLMAPYFIWI